MKAHEFDKKFENNEDLIADLDLSKAKRSMQKQNRSLADASVIQSLVEAVDVSGGETKDATAHKTDQLDGNADKQG